MASSAALPVQNKESVFKLSRAMRRKADLLYLLTRKEIALKYKRSLLGIFWSLLNPILLSLVFFVAFKVFMRFKVENYTFFLLSALFPWNWFLSSIVISARSLVENVTLIKKVIFPRHYLVVSVILAQGVHLLFSLPILLVLAYTSGEGPSLNWLVGIPLLIAVQFFFTFGLALGISICNTFFRDIEYLVGVFLNLIFWMTPITYPMDAIPARFHPYFMLNPLADIMAAWRELFLHNHILWMNLGIGAAVALLFLYIGFAVFIRLERRLDEVL